MKTNYEDLDSALNIESSIVEVEKDIIPIDIVPTQPDDIKKDYEYTRANLYSLIEKGQEAINGIMELAGDGGSPRAYEVAGQLIKTQADMAKDLMTLHKQKKEVDGDRSSENQNIKTQNNIVFAGSTAELMKMIASERARTIDAK